MKNFRFFHKRGPGPARIGADRRGSARIGAGWREPARAGRQSAAQNTCIVLIPAFLDIITITGNVSAKSVVKAENWSHIGFIGKRTALRMKHHLTQIFQGRLAGKKGNSRQ
jgi:hypothetical protein